MGSAESKLARSGRHGVPGPDSTKASGNGGAPQTGIARRPIARPSPLNRREPKLRHAGKRRSPHHRFLEAHTPNYDCQRAPQRLRAAGRRATLTDRRSSMAPPIFMGASRPCRAGKPSVKRGDRQQASQDSVRAPSSAPRAALCHRAKAGRCRAASQRARSNGSPRCRTASKSGTSLRATAHTALVLSPPLRARSAS